MPIRNSRAHKAFLLVAIVYSISLLVLSLLNLEDLPQLELTGTDKVLHATAYFGLVVVWFLQYFVKQLPKTRVHKVLLIISALSFVFGTIVEFIQVLATTYRTFDVFDMLANFIGVTLAYILLISLRSHLEKLK